MLRMAWVVVLVPLAGCDLISSWFQQDIELPVDLVSPPQDFDVTQPITDAETQACNPDPQSAGCQALTAICNTENGRNCAPPSMPGEFPATIDVGGNTVTANSVMSDMGITKATEIQLALPVDVSGALAAQGVGSTDAIKAVTIVDVAMQWPANSLTFDAPPLDLYITDQDVGNGPLDAQALITAGTVQKVGTIGLDIDNDGQIDVGQVAGSTSDVPVVFVDGGNDLFNTAVKSAKFTVVTAVPDGKGLKLKEAADDNTKVLKPTGAGTVQLKATLSYKVSAADIVAATQ